MMRRNTVETETLLYDLYTEAEFLNEIQAIVFFLAIYSHLYSFAMRFIFLHTHVTSYIFLHFSYCTRTLYKGERRKT
jgi:hypothetical protein